MQLHEERMNNKALAVENMKVKISGEMDQSPISIKRVQKDIQEIQESEAVKEYKFIT